MIKKLLGAFAIAASSTIFAPLAANASVIVIPLPDIGTSVTYTDLNVGQTFAGDGFVGEYSDNNFAHLFGLEGTFSQTVAQANISGLAGTTILSATLSFNLIEAFNLGTATTVTGYAGNGALGYQFGAPAALYGSALSGPIVAGTNFIDVTGIVASAIFASEDWLNLHLQNSAFSDWTYTWAGFGYGPDRAEVRLTIEFEQVPEPATLALIGMALFSLIGFGLMRRRADA